LGIWHIFSNVLDIHPPSLKSIVFHTILGSLEVYTSVYEKLMDLIAVHRDVDLYPQPDKTAVVADKKKDN